MHRRARHLNPSSAGAFAAYDARFITGLADGASVSSWSDRTANANTLTGTNQPTYEANELNGNPVVRFDGSNDQLTASFTTASLQSAVLVAKQNSASVQFRAYFAVRSLSNARLFFFRDGSDYTLGTFATSFASRNISFSGYNIASCAGNASSMLTAVNGVTATVSASYTYSGGVLDVGNSASGGGPYPLPCDISYLTLWASELASPLRRRFEQAAALSFKLPCS